MFEQKIIEQNANLTYYANMVEKVKEENEIIFKDIYKVIDMIEKDKKKQCQISYGNSNLILTLDLLR